MAKLRDRINSFLGIGETEGGEDYQKALDRIEKCKQKKNKSLSFYHLKINQIPPEVVALDWLEELDLGRTPIQDISVLQSLPQLQVLRLYDCKQLKEIKILKHLTQLQRLVLGQTKVRNISVLQFLTQLETLILDFTPIQNISVLKKLPQLSSLSLFACKKITNLSVIQSLTQLEVLNLGSTDIKDLSLLKGLSQLKDLRLGGCKSLEDFIGLQDLTQLQKLNLSHTNIDDLSSLQSLTQLSNLDLQWCRKISNISVLTALTELSFLDLTYCKRISEFSVLKDAKQLQKLDLSQNKISNIDFLRGLVKLTNLNLSGTLVSNISALKGLNELKTLDLTRTPIQDISVLVPLIREGVPVAWNEYGRFRKITFFDNPQLTTPPPEIVEQGNEAILAFFDAKGEGESAEEGRLYEAKLLILGESGSGKTSLFRKLQSLALPGEDESTEGIDIHELYFEGKNGPFRINLWDFGGQEIYHATHQFFLTKRSLYILVTDGRKENTDFNYWLRTIELWSGNSPLLMLGNIKHGRKEDIDLTGLQKRFTNILNPVHYVDLKEDQEGLEKLKEAIEYHIQTLDHVGIEWPASWVRVRKRLEALAEKEAYIDVKSYLKICKEEGISNQKGAFVLSQFLHDLGVCLHFQDDEYLSRTLILQNDWATDGVYKVLDDEKLKAKVGSFDSKDVRSIYQGQDYELMRGEMMALMRKFELCYHVPDTTSPKEFIAPQLLKKQQPTFEGWAEEAKFLELRYEYDFMPKGIAGRFIVRKHRYIRQVMQEAWRSGVYLHRRETKAELIETYGKSFLRVRVQGPDAKTFMTIIKDEVDAIHRTYPNLKVKALIPCICDVCEQRKAAQQNPHFYAYSNLLYRREKGKMTVECDYSFEDVPVDELIDAIFTPISPNPEDDPYETQASSQTPSSNQSHVHGNNNITLQHIQGDIHIHQYIDQRSIQNQLPQLRQLVSDEQQAGFISREEYEELLDILEEIKETPKPSARQKKRWKRWGSKLLEGGRKFAGKRLEKGIDTAVSEETKDFIKSGGLDELGNWLGML